jgi:Domain of unknown function (DUF6457)
MSEWTDRLAETLGVAPIDRDQEDSILKTSREIAHRVERKDTPLTTYLIGVSVGTATTSGTDPAAALGIALDAVLAALPPDSGP